MDGSASRTRPTRSTTRGSRRPDSHQPGRAARAHRSRRQEQDQQAAGSERRRVTTTGQRRKRRRRLTTSSSGDDDGPEEEAEGSRHYNPQQERHDRRTSLWSDDDSLDEAKEKREDAIKEAEEKRKDDRLQVDIKREGIKNNMENQIAFNKDMAKMQKFKKDNFKVALEDLNLGVDPNTLRPIQKNKGRSCAAKMLFLFILVGCELDVVGFVMALPSYWGTGFAVVKVMLIVGPLSYIVALLVYKHESKRTIREPVNVEMYHCLPVVRIYLLFKDLVPNDVECVFRANSVSSFTLGTSQLVVFLFTMIGGTSLDIFQKINIASFSVNWTITILYFATSVPNRMKASMAVDALEYQTNVMLRRDFAEYKKNVDKYASTGSAKDKDEVDDFLHKVEKEIELYTSVKVPIANEQFTPMQVNELRRAVHRKFNDEYANIV